MAKSARDIADLLDILVDAKMTQIPSGGYRGCLTSSFAELKIGALDPTIWNFVSQFTAPNESATEQMVSNMLYVRHEGASIC